MGKQVIGNHVTKWEQKEWEGIEGVEGALENDWLDENK